MTESANEALSRAGEMRREAMLDDLLDVMARTQRARRTRRRTIAATATICVSVLAVWVVGPFSGVDSNERVSPIADNGLGRDPTTTKFAPAPHAIGTNLAGDPGHLQRRVAPPAPVNRAVVIRTVRTDPSIVERYRATSVDRAVRLDDEALIDTLASIHRPAGLIRFGDRVALSAPVTDAQLGMDR